MLAVSRKERDRLIRKADILNTAERLFATKGYHQTTVADIAREAQYAVGTIYLYFKDKEQIYLTLIEEKTGELFSRLKERVGKVNGALNKIRTIVEEQLSYFESNADFFQIYFSEQGERRWTIKDKISRSSVEGFYKYLEYVTEVIKLAQEERLVRKELDPKRCAHALAAMLHSTVFPWLKGREATRDLRSVSGFILDIFLNGVGTGK